MKRHHLIPLMAALAIPGILAAAGTVTLAQIPNDPGEFGDAPEGAPAYPNLGIAGGFPTCLGGPAGFVFHANQMPLAWFGPTMDPEPDGNAGFCPSPPYEMDECWGPADGDGGLVNVTTYTIFQNQITICGGQVPDPLAPTCSVVQWGTAMDVQVTNISGNVALINVLIDWDQDGRWGGQSTCPGGTPEPEHVVWNLPVPDGYAGMLSGLSPGPIQVGPNQGYLWMRLTIGDPVPILLGWDGSYFFDTGETEDYLIEIGDGLALGPGELGDAPEDVVAYPSGVIGRFPTCIATGGSATYVYHTAPLSGHFGPLADLEGDGNQDLCSFTQYEHDECHQGDGDGGLLMPASYTLIGGSPFVCSTGPQATLGGPCQKVVWGADLDILIDNAGGPDMFLNGLADWDMDGQWGNTVTCSNGDTGVEHVIVNQVVPGGFFGPASTLGLPSCQILNDGGYVWLRFTLSDAAVAQNWNGEGVFGDGETEDYLVWVSQPTGTPERPDLGAGILIRPNTPNPFNPSTTIRFVTARPGPVEVAIHDLSGRRIKTLASGLRESGEHEILWRGDDDQGRRQPSGVFFVRVASGAQVQSGKIMMLK